MKDAKWWTVDTVFAVGLGVLMAGAFGASFFARSGYRASGSALVPAAVLEKLIDQGGRCQTITDEDVTSHVPRKPC
jgi:hypothetical protein